MDFLLALLFLVWYEILSWPLRAALARWVAPDDVRRTLSRVAGPALLTLPIWFLGHAGGKLGAWSLGAHAAWLGIAAALAAGIICGGVPGNRRDWLRRLGYAFKADEQSAGALKSQPGTAVPQLIASPEISGKKNKTARLSAAAMDTKSKAAVLRPIPRKARFEIPARLRPWLLEGMCVLLYFGFIAFRRWVPEMTTSAINGSGAEKFPNMMLFWTSWLARTLPPEDYWLSGHTLLYYYWGQFHWAWSARIVGFAPEIAINLAQARLSLLVWESAYLLARALSLRPAWAAGAALCAAWGGNFAAVAEAWRLWNLPAADFSFADYGYWNASRVIPNVVDEIPSFSAILGDFHAHHLGLPWLTGWLALLLAGRRWHGRAATRDLRDGILWIAIWAGLMVVGVLANAWYLPVFGFAAGLWIVALWLRRRSEGARALGVLFIAGVALGLAWHLLRRGAPLPLPEDTGGGLLARLPLRGLPVHLRSTLGQLWMMWGLPLFALPLALAAKFGSVVARGRRPKAQPRAAVPQGSHAEKITQGWVTFAAMGVAIIFALPGMPAWLGGTAWAWIAALLGGLALAQGSRPWISQRALWLLAGACATLAALELIYLQDRFTGDYVRYNSYFKFSYPLWMPLIVVAASLLARVCRVARPWPVAWLARGGVAALVLAALVYPALAFPARVLQGRYGELPGRPLSLNAVNFIEYLEPYREEAEALAYIRAVVPPGDVVACAPALEPYTYGGRVASLAGRPVPLGWIHHEQQWRGPVEFPMLDARAQAVDGFFRAPSPEAMRARGQALEVRWAFYGLEEIKRYGPTTGPAFRTLSAAATKMLPFPAQSPKVFLFVFSPFSATIGKP